MKSSHSLGLFTLALSLSMSSAWAAKVGQPAPEFTGQDNHGKTISLSQLKGKYVVLEWHNDECPYVKTQYNTGHMQKAQKEWTGKGVVWLSVASSARGAEGHLDAKSANADIVATHASPTAVLLDESGAIGHAYDAKTTPHMFVIDPKGTLIYNGAIDDSADHDQSDVTDKSVNYVSLALAEAMAGKPLSHPTTQPFGCSVKYK